MNNCGIHVQISSDPVDVSHLIQFVTDPSAGGISLFLGTTRDHIQGTFLHLTKKDPMAPSKK